MKIPTDLTIEEYLSGVSSKQRGFANDSYEVTVKASLTTRDGFHKYVYLPEFQPIVSIARFKQIGAPVAYNFDKYHDDSISYERIDFYLKKHRIVEPLKGLHYIFAVYKEI